MKNLPSRKRVRNILQHWRWWARDLPPDSAEIHYYTVSPMFRSYAKPTPKSIRYDTQVAEMTEDVMRELYKWKPSSRIWLMRYWLYIPNNQDLADTLTLSPDRPYGQPPPIWTQYHKLEERRMWSPIMCYSGSISKSTVRRHMVEAHYEFAKHWRLLFPRV